MENKNDDFNKRIKVRSLKKSTSQGIAQKPRWILLPVRKKLTELAKEGFTEEDKQYQ